MKKKKEKRNSWCKSSANQQQQKQPNTEHEQNQNIKQKKSEKMMKHREWKIGQIGKCHFYKRERKACNFESFNSINI